MLRNKVGVIKADSEDLEYALDNINEKEILKAKEYLIRDGDFEVVYTPPEGERDYRENWAEVGGAPWTVTPGIFYWGNPPYLSIDRVSNENQEK